MKFKIGGTSSHVLLVCSLLFMINYMDRQVLSAVLEPMKVDLVLTDQKTILLRLFILIALMGQLVAQCSQTWHLVGSSGASQPSLTFRICEEHVDTHIPQLLQPRLMFICFLATALGIGIIEL